MPAASRIPPAGNPIGVRTVFWGGYQTSTITAGRILQDCARVMCTGVRRRRCFEAGLLSAPKRVSNRSRWSYSEVRLEHSVHDPYQIAQVNRFGENWRPESRIRRSFHLERSTGRHAEPAPQAISEAAAEAESRFAGERVAWETEPGANRLWQRAAEASAECSGEQLPGPSQSRSVADAVLAARLLRAQGQGQGRPHSLGRPSARP